MRCWTLGVRVHVSQTSTSTSLPFHQVIRCVRLSVTSQDVSTSFTLTELKSCLYSNRLTFLAGTLNKDFTRLSICFPLDNWVTEHILYVFTTQHWRLFSLSFPSTLPPSIPFLLLNTAPSQPMESQTTAGRQWSFCKYHGYIPAW